MAVSIRSLPAWAWDVTGPDIGKARSSAKIETDFGGFSGSNTMLRIRQAYVNLDWGKSAVLVGITWHPLFGAVMPDVLNLSTGAPFQPFNRSLRSVTSIRRIAGTIDGFRVVAITIPFQRTERHERGLY